MEPMETIQTSFGRLLRENLMGEASNDALKLECHGTKVTRDAGYFFGKSLTGSGSCVF